MGTQSQTHCTGSARGLGQTTVQTAQPGLHNQQTTQQGNPQLTLLLMAVIVIPEEPLSIQGDPFCNNSIVIFPKGVMTVGMILGDVLGAKLAECRTAGVNILMYL